LAAGNPSALSILGEGGTARVICGGASKLRTFALVMAVVLLNAGGNLLMAWGMKHIPEVSWNPLGYLRAMLNPFVAAGIAVLIMWLLTRMALLSWADLSFVLPLTGLGYILNAALGRLFLNESITPAHWAGTLLVFAGTAMVGSTQHHTGWRSEAPR
jgi:drug/metabolite transporter (DMT)-like permease